MKKTALFKRYFETPIGLLEITANKSAITSIVFCDEQDISRGRTDMLGSVESGFNTTDVLSNQITQAAEQQLHEYFTKQRTVFNLPLERVGTQFQCSVWSALQNIEYGNVTSYKDIATVIMKPNSARAVGSANRKNRHAIVVPCHRVIASNGMLAGYAGGLDRKAWLLKHEGATLF